MSDSSGPLPAIRDADEAAKEIWYFLLAEIELQKRYGEDVYRQGRISGLTYALAALFDEMISEVRVRAELAHLDASKANWPWRPQRRGNGK